MTEEDIHVQRYSTDPHFMLGKMQLIIIPICMKIDINRWSKKYEISIWK